MRLFSFGVGYDVDAVLLDTLSEAHHGATTYVLPDQDIDETVSAFYAKVSTPVLTDLDLDLGDARAFDLVPEIAARPVRRRPADRRRPLPQSRGDHRPSSGHVEGRSEEFSST